MKIGVTKSTATRVFLLTLLGAFLVVAVLLPGCWSSHPSKAGLQSDSAVKSYHMKGIIVATDASKGEIQVNSEAIPGFMDAMVMPYKLKDPGIIQDLHAGDHLTATLLVSDSTAVLDQLVITAQAKPDYKPDSDFHVPTAGDEVPDFKFVNQDARHISVRQFRGKAVLITFIYTRCPLPDYCPRMMRNFAAIDKQMRTDSSLYAKTHLLSISFDPAYDSPPVLRSYGRAYMSDPDFHHWDVAAPAKSDLTKVLQYFDVGATPERDKTITHSLSTVLLGPDGKVAAWYPTNEWTVEEVMQAMKFAVDGRRS